MTINNLLEALHQYQLHIGGVLLFFVLLTHLILSLKSASSERQFSDYLLSVILYSVSVPGIFFMLLLLYHILFLNHNILELNVLIYFFPIVTMAYTFYIIAKKMNIKSLPGFEKYKSILIIIAIVLLAIFFLMRLHFVIGFFGSITALVAIGVAIFLILKKAFKKIL